MGSRVYSVMSWVLLAAVAVGGAACGDDAGDTGGSGEVGGGGAGAAGGAGGGGGGGGGESVVLVRGTLFTTDLAAAKASHDAVSAGGEMQAKAAGDFGHDAMLGTTLLGSTQDAFLGIDRWDNLSNAQQFYQDPAIADAFGMLFAMPPTVEFFTRVDWHGWGDLTSGDAFTPHWFVVVRGRLAESDSSAAQSAHDAIAAQGETPALAAGDVAHVVHLGAADPQEFFAVDVWEDDASLEA